MQQGWKGNRRQRRHLRSLAPRAARTGTKRRLTLEPLEDRRLLAAFSHPDSGLNSYLSVDRNDYREASLIVQYRTGTSSVSSLAAYFSGANTDDTWSLMP